MVGGEGNDHFFGGDDGDHLIGGKGRDVLMGDGGAGEDTLFGGGAEMTSSIATKAPMNWMAVMAMTSSTLAART